MSVGLPPGTPTPPSVEHPIDTWLVLLEASAHIWGHTSVVMWVAPVMSALAV